MIRKSVLMGVLTITILGLIFAGVTLAYFTDEDKNPETVLVLGNVAIDISQEDVHIDTNSDFLACKNVKWIIENTGSKTAYLRAKVITNWEADEECSIDEDASAWAEGTRFTEQGNWAMYFKYNAQNEETLSVPLIASKHYNAGTVTVKKDVENNELTVSISTNQGWKLDFVKMHIGKSLDDFPINKGGNPMIGQFDYHSGDLNSASSYQRSIPLNGDVNHDIYYIAVHAEVQGCISGCNNNGNNEPDYSIEVISDGWTQRPDNDGWYYYKETVAPYEEIPFEVKVCLEQPWEGNLDLSIETEAVQASNNAAEYEWGIDLKE